MKRFIKIYIKINIFLFFLLIYNHHSKIFIIDYSIYSPEYIKVANYSFEPSLDLGNYEMIVSNNKVDHHYKLAGILNSILIKNGSPLTINDKYIKTISKERGLVIADDVSKIIFIKNKENNNIFNALLSNYDLNIEFFGFMKAIIFYIIFFIFIYFISIILYDKIFIKKEILKILNYFNIKEDKKLKIIIYIKRFSYIFLAYVPIELLGEIFGDISFMEIIKKTLTFFI